MIQKNDDLDSLDRVPSSPERRHCCHPVKKTILMLIEDFEEDDKKHWGSMMLIVQGIEPGKP